MKRVAVRGNDNQEGHLGEIASMFTMLRESGCDIFVASDFADYLESQGLDLTGTTRADVLPDETALVLSLGGDGTFLRSAEWVGDSGVPVAGVNTGHLGYLTAFSLRKPEEIKEAVAGRFDISPRITLEMESAHMPEGFRPYALNEVSVSKGDTTSMVEIHAFVDNHYLADYQADGLVVATPTGSTAYNLSCGGPILQPDMSCIILSPIAPHSLTLRPLVVSAQSEVRLEVRSRGEECHVGVDGRSFAVPADGVSIRIRKAGLTVNVAQPVGCFFSEVLRKKLRWGEGLR